MYIILTSQAQIYAVVGYAADAGS